MPAPSGPPAEARPLRILVVCTANQCRSPMVERLLSSALAERHVEAVVGSAGLLDGGRPASTGSVKAMARVGIDLGDHVSRRIDVDLADEADLLITMERAHLAAIAALSPDAARRSFTLRELVRLSTRVAPLPPGGDLRTWTRAVDALRPTAAAVDAPSPDDVSDPIGGSRRQYRRTAAEVAELVEQLTAAWSRRDR